MISLAGKAALITGGSRGIGAATVKLFAQAGADVVFGYHRTAKRPRRWRRKPASTARASNLSRPTWENGRGEKAGGLHARAAGPQSIFWWRTRESGTSEDAPIEKLTEREWDEMIRVNLKSVYAVVHYRRAAHDRAARRPNRRHQFHGRRSAARRFTRITPRPKAR